MKSTQLYEEMQQQTHNRKPRRLTHTRHTPNEIKTVQAVGAVFQRYSALKAEADACAAFIEAAMAAEGLQARSTGGASAVGDEGIAAATSAARGAAAAAVQAGVPASAVSSAEDGSAHFTELEEAALGLGRVFVHLAESWLSLLTSREEVGQAQILNMITSVSEFPADPYSCTGDEGGGCFFFSRRCDQTSDCLLLLLSMQSTDYLCNYHLCTYANKQTNAHSSRVVPRAQLLVQVFWRNPRYRLPRRGGP